MAIRVHIHRSQRQFTNGMDVVEAQGNTVGDCLKELVRKFPGMGENLFTKTGKLNPIVEIYVNAESAYPDELTKPVKEGDDIHITMMLAGG